jgi:oxysterol-binding protein-related protein 9/10/11
VVRQSGHAVFTIDKHNESYLLPFPDVYAKSVLTGSPYPELQGTYKIFSTSGLTAEIIFGSKTRRLLSGGERNVFSASIYKTNDKSKKSFYELGGSWSDSWEVKDGSGKELYTYDLSDAKNKPVTMNLAPPEKQSPWESRRAWKDVAEPLRAGDFGKALSAKSKIETAQREMRKKEKAEGRTWESAFFRRVDDESKEGQLSQLLEIVGKDADSQSILGSDGIWRFDQERAKAWRSGQRSWPETPFG